MEESNPEPAAPAAAAAAPAVEESTPEPAAAPAPAVAAAPSTSAPPPGLEDPAIAASSAPSAHKKALPKSQSSRFRPVGDEAVVMPAGVNVGKVGMQFGSLSLGGDGEFYQQEEQSACVLPGPTLLRPSSLACPSRSTDTLPCPRLRLQPGRAVVR